MKLYPKCHPYWVDDDGKRIENPRQVSGEYSARGFILPCCWCDQLEEGNKELATYGILDEELKLENNESVKSIMLSKQWVSFHRLLLEEPEKAPTICKKKCRETPEETEEYSRVMKDLEIS